MGQRLDRAGVRVVADMTEEERVQRSLFLPHVNKVRTNIEIRLDFLEADARGARAAILKMKRDFNWVCFVMGAVFAALGIERLFL